MPALIDGAGQRPDAALEGRAQRPLADQRVDRAADAGGAEHALRQLLRAWRQRLGEALGAMLPGPNCNAEVEHIMNTIRGRVVGTLPHRNAVR